MKNVLLKVKTGIPIYGGELSLIVAKDLHQAYRDLADSVMGTPNWVCEDDEPLHFQARCSFEAANGNGALWFRTNLQHREIAHECLHLILYVYKSVGAKVDLDNQEPLAYFFDDIVLWVYAQLKKHKIRVR